ncbi:glycosyltransferase family 4 protein [Floridanema aerugineum]|uniref:Glycosyltransferase family 4 protein n=1 Tax=Floridaenema aerugineum BLCC-F46 TaxID=3153654 RepID=A0ABV4XAX4_9CYAN
MTETKLKTPELLTETVNNSKLMHVIVLEQQPSSARGGQELNLFEICRTLSEKGHKISLFYVKPGDLVEKYQQFCEQVIKVNSYGFDRRKVSDIINFLPSFRDIWKVTAKDNSVVFINQYPDAFYGYLLSLFKQVPFVCYLQIPPPVNREEFNLQRRIGMKGVNKFIAVSQQTKNEWLQELKLTEEKIDVVYNGTNFEKFKLAENLAQLRNSWNIPEDTRVVSYVGRLDKDKGLELLIEAFALFLKTGKKAKLFIAGKPLLHFSADGKECPLAGEEYKQSLKQIAIALGIEQSVEFLGHLSNPTSVYQVSDLTVVPSLWSEPFGRVVIESMACGTPVVGSRIGGIPEILTGEFAAGLFEPGNAQDLAKTLNKMIDWRDTNPQLGAKSREYTFNKFSLETMINGVEKVLLKVVKE